MKCNELIGKVSEKFNLNKKQSKEVVEYVLEELMQAGISGEGFKSSIFRIHVKDVPEKTLSSSGEEKHVPARKVMKIVPSKGGKQSIAS